MVVREPSLALGSALLMHSPGTLTPLTARRHSLLPVTQMSSAGFLGCSGRSSFSTTPPSQFKLITAPPTDSPLLSAKTAGMPSLFASRSRITEVISLHASEPILCLKNNVKEKDIIAATMGNCCVLGLGEYRGQQMTVLDRTCARIPFLVGQVVKSGNGYPSCLLILPSLLCLTSSW